MPDSAAARLCLAGGLLGLLGLPGPAAAGPAPLDARVVWVREDRVYLAAPDSLALGPGARLTFVSRGRTLATGEVTGLFGGELALARLTSGSLREAKDLRRVRILAGPARGPRLLRLGYPSRKRSTPFFACDRLALDPSGPAGSFRVEPREERAYTVLPDPDVSRPVPWPETLLVRLFDDPADQEIALERGELDVGVFWPGELSTHMREHPRWQDFLYGPRSRGLVATIRLEPATSEERRALTDSDRRALDSLDRELFRGDLQDWRARPAGASHPDPMPGARSPRRSRIEVDPSCPGRQVIERSLDRGRGSQAPPDGGGTLRLFCLDCRADQADSIAFAAADYVRSGPFPPGLRARADTLAALLRRERASGVRPAPGWPLQVLEDSLRVALPFAMRCPVVCDPALRPYVSALGAKALVDLFDCRAAGGRP